MVRVTKTVYWLNYTCQVCGGQGRTAQSESKRNLEKKIPHCLVCNRAMCVRCMKYECICTDHYNMLPPDSRAQIDLYLKGLSKRTWFGGLTCLATSILFFVELTASFDTNGFFGNTLFSMPFPFGIPLMLIYIVMLMCLWCYLISNNSQRLKVPRKAVERILTNLSKQPTPNMVQNTTRQASAPTSIPKKTPKQTSPSTATYRPPVQKPNEIVCPTCGVRNPIGSFICDGCGAELSAKPASAPSPKKDDDGWT